MLSSLLTSDRAIEVNILIMRAIVKLRQLLATHAELAFRLRASARSYRRAVLLPIRVCLMGYPDLLSNPLLVAANQRPPPSPDRHAVAVCTVMRLPQVG
jgi:hypothetical protein